MKFHIFIAWPKSSTSIILHPSICVAVYFTHVFPQRAACCHRCSTYHLARPVHRPRHGPSLSLPSGHQRPPCRNRSRPCLGVKNQEEVQMKIHEIPSRNWDFKISMLMAADGFMLIASAEPQQKMIKVTANATALNMESTLYALNYRKTIYLSIYLSIYPSTYLPTYLWFPIYLISYLSVRLSANVDILYLMHLITYGRVAPIPTFAKVHHWTHHGHGAHHWHGPHHVVHGASFVPAFHWSFSGLQFWY